MAEKSALLTNVLEHITQGVVMFDRSRHLVLWNSQYERILQFPSGFLKTGLANREMTLYLAKRGDLGEGDPDRLTDERLSLLWAKSRSHAEITVRGDKSYEVRFQRTDDDGLVATYSDVTDRKRSEEALRASEEQFRGAFETSAAGMALHKLDGTYLKVNQTFCNILGYTEPEFLQLNWRDVTHPEDIGPTEELDDQAETGALDNFVLEKRYLHKDGKIVWARVFSAHLRDADGVPRFILGQINDITELKNAEQILRESEERLSLSLKSGGIGTFSWDIKNGTHFWDDRNHEIWGFEPGTYTGRAEADFLDNLHPEDAGAVRETLDRVFSNDEEFNIEYRIIRPNGNIAHVHAAAILVRDELGEPETLIGVSRDITDRKLAELELARQRDELILLNQQKSRFFSIIAHDLKNPFNVMIGYADLIDRMGEEMSREEMLDMAHSVSASGRKLYQLLEDLLAWGRSQMNADRINPEALSTSDLFDAGLDGLRDVADLKGVKVNLQPGEIEFVADPDMMTTVIRNLVSNAIKFTPPRGGVVVSAEAVRSRSQDGQIVFTVTDTGIGMNEEHLDQLFRIDTNQSTPGTDGETGSGLGLLLCKDFIEKHGGSISAASKEGMGTTISFTVPAQPPVVANP